MPAVTRQQLDTATAIIRTWLRGIVYSHEWPGLAVGMVHDNQVALLQGYGHADAETARPVTPDTPFSIASISKTFTAVAIMRLVERGALRLDDRAADHVEWFATGRPDVQRRITVRHLLTHTGGIMRDGEPFWDTDEFPDGAGLRRIAGADCGVIPSALRIKYSNIAYGVLGAIIEAVAGTTYRKHVHREILEPLGLESTSFGPDEPTARGLAVGYGRRVPGRPREKFSFPDAGALTSATGLASTVRDLCSYMSAQFDGDMRLLTDEAKRETRRVHWDKPDRGERQAIGYQLRSDHGFSLCAHTGGFPGYQSVVMFDPVQRIGVTVLVNAIDAQPRSVAIAVLHIIRTVVDRWDEFGGEATDADLDACVGDYAGRWDTGHMVRINRQLAWMASALEVPLAEAYRMEPLGAARFRKVGDGLYGDHSEVATADIQDGRAIAWRSPGSSRDAWNIPTLMSPPTTPLGVVPIETCRPSS